MRGNLFLIYLRHFGSLSFADLSECHDNHSCDGDAPAGNLEIGGQDGQVDHGPDQYEKAPCSLDDHGSARFDELQCGILRQAGQERSEEGAGNDIEDRVSGNFQTVTAHQDGDDPKCKDEDHPVDGKDPGMYGPYVALCKHDADGQEQG